jgi:probable F420-dependent oxidoreductase
LRAPKDSDAENPAIDNLSRDERGLDVKRTSEPTFGLTLVGGGAMAQPLMAGELARTAEHLGFAALWVPEHVIVPMHIESRYPYTADGTFPRGAQMVDAPDPFVWLSYVAAATDRIRLGTGVLVLPQRDPFVVAKQVASLDLLSGGRLELGIGVGWMAEEFDVLGASFEDRGRRTDEYIAVMRRLWSEHPASFSGDYVSFEACTSLPHPVQPDGVPIIVGGDSAAAARRAGRLGNGWFPGSGDPDRLAPLVEVVRDTATSAGRDPDRVMLYTGLPGDDRSFNRLVDLGFSHFTVGVASRRLLEPGGLGTTLRSLASRVGLV